VPGLANKFITSVVPRLVPRGLLLRAIELIQAGRFGR